MALLHRAQLTPTKFELLSGWVPAQPWWAAGSAPIEVLGAYRFDDPAGEVGIETHLVATSDGSTAHVPTTYRAAPLPGAESALLGTMQHSVLGERWVYDGCADPVYAIALATAILTGGVQAELMIAAEDGSLQPREPTTRVVGSGAPDTDVPAFDTLTTTTDGDLTTMCVGALTVQVRRVIAGVFATYGEHETLVGTWPGQDEPVILALARWL